MIIVTQTQLMAATGCNRADAERHLPWLNKAMSHYLINKNRLRIAAFLAQIGHESQNLSRMSENLNYSKEGLIRVWPTRFNEYSATTYARQPEAIANCVYANRMGNGPEFTGDGWKYRGRGHIQITGRYNYTVCGEAIGLDLLKNPDLLLEPEHAAIASAWYWGSNHLNKMADERKFDSISLTINRYDKDGMPKRRALYVQALNALR